MFRKSLSLTVIVCFLLTTLSPYPQAHADTVVGLPEPGTMINLSPAYEPVIIKGLTVHKDNPFLFDFMVDVGQDKMSGKPLKKEGEKLIKYFLASLAIPDTDLWVNLSPYEKNRMIPEALGQTDMGRDLLEQDYILKQITASLIYPEKQLGKTFWDKVYAKAQEMYGTTQVPVNTFNKVWIMADRAEVFEHNQTAFVVDSHLKVMLEEDYLALQKHNPGVIASAAKQSHTFSSQIVRTIILPELEKEVNTGRNFANLRQIFNSIILSSWYKKNLKEALLNQVYANKSKVKGVSASGAKQSQEQIYEQYLKAYKKGVFNYIKEDVNAAGATIPRKYFSGGMEEGAAANPTVTTDSAMLRSSLQDTNLVDFATLATTEQAPSDELRRLSIESTVKRIASEMSGIEEKKITLKTSLRDDLGLDSLDVPKLIMDIEDAYGFEIPDAAVEKFDTIGDIVKHIEGRKPDAAMSSESVGQRVLALKAEEFANSFKGLEGQRDLIQKRARQWARDRALTWEDLKSVLDTSDKPNSISRQAAAFVLGIPEGQNIINSHSEEVWDTLLDHIDPKVERNDFVRLDSYRALFQIDPKNAKPLVIKAMSPRVEPSILVRTIIIRDIIGRNIEKFRGNPVLREALVKAGHDNYDYQIKIAANIAIRRLDSVRVPTDAAMASPKMRLNDLRGKVYGKIVVVREGYDVTLDKNGNLDNPNDPRIIESLPSIDDLTSWGAKVVLASHLGRPEDQVQKLLKSNSEMSKEEARNIVFKKMSLAPVAKKLTELRGNKIQPFNPDFRTIPDAMDYINDVMKPGDVMLLENLRFNEGEEANDSNFAKELFKGADAYVNDAPSVNHRAHASIVGAPAGIPRVMGHLTEKENDILKDVLENATLAVIGGGKVSGKIKMIRQFLLSNSERRVLIGGAMANAFLKAQGINVQKSIGAEDKDVEIARALMEEFNKGPNKRIVIPHDVMAVDDFQKPTQNKIINFSSGEKVPENWMIVDIGPETTEEYAKQINANTFWNGPMGAYDFLPKYASKGTSGIAQAIALKDAWVGGGDSVVAWNKDSILSPEFRAKSKAKILTGGGASLEFLEGKPLPGIEALSDAAMTAAVDEETWKKAEAATNSTRGQILSLFNHINNHGQGNLSDFVKALTAHAKLPKRDAAMSSNGSPGTKIRTTQAAVNGGIDLNTSNGMQWKVSKDGQGVEMNVDPAMIERVRREGIDNLSPIIFRITPVVSIWPLVGLQTPAQAQRLAGV